MSKSWVDFSQFSTFGDYLRYLRRTAQLSQRDLSIAVGYSESQISRLESNQRAPDRSSLLALFVPALHITDQQPLIDRLLELAAINRHDPVGKKPEKNSPEQVRNHLPVQLTSFVGREADLDRLGQMLSDPNTRLVTITGEGGCGKTRLALQAGSNIANQYPEGVWLVELGLITDPELIINATLGVFSINASMDQPLISILKNYIGSKKLLLILDNCEHIIDAAANLTAALLRACPALTVLATSRECLGVPGEAVFRALPLAKPAIQDGSLPTKAHIESYEAVQLFCVRARSALYSFALTDNNAPAVARICQRVDGIPLAIELAASWVNVLNVDQIADKLESDFNFLTGKSRTALPQHQTLRATLDWSYQLLLPLERLLLRRLSVFIGGFTLDAVEEVCSLAGDPETQVPKTQTLEQLANLVNKSLVLVDHPSATETRYFTLETVRSYILEKLDEAGETNSVKERHLVYYCKLAEQSETGLKSENQVRWMRLLLHEQENFRSAFHYCLAGKRVEECLHLAGFLGFYWMMRGFEQENQRWLETALGLAASDATLKDHPSRAKVLLHLGLLRYQSINCAPTVTFETWEESLQISRQCGDNIGAGAALCFLGIWHANQGQVDASDEAFEKSLHHLGRAEDSWWIAETLH